MGETPPSLSHGSADRNSAKSRPWTDTFRVALSRERGSKRGSRGRAARPHRVALSRERGSKRRIGQHDRPRRRSLSHGSADRNLRGSRLSAARFVALSRERGSKLNILADPLVTRGRSLTGARIETSGAQGMDGSNGGRSLTGARIETRRRGPSRSRSESLSHGSADRNLFAINRRHLRFGRSLTGARIETFCGLASARRRGVALSRERGSKRAKPRPSARPACVALSRERGSKPAEGDPPGHRRGVALSRERGSKRVGLCCDPADFGRSLTGARIETCRRNGTTRSTRSLSHGSADRNRTPAGQRVEMVVALSRERGSKLLGDQPAAARAASLSHGSADRNKRDCLVQALPYRRSLTGARIETCRTTP